MIWLLSKIYGVHIDDCSFAKLWIVLLAFDHSMSIKRQVHNKNKQPCHPSKHLFPTREIYARYWLKCSLTWQSSELLVRWTAWWVSDLRHVIRMKMAIPTAFQSNSFIWLFSTLFQTIRDVPLSQPSTLPISGPSGKAINLIREICHAVYSSPISVFLQRDIDFVWRSFL